MARLTVREVVSEVITRTASEELPLLRGLESMDDTSVARALGRRARRREPLGFGLDTTVALITPILWAVLSDVVREGVETAVGNVIDRVKRRLRRWWRARSRSRRNEPLVLPPLRPEQVSQVRQMILDQCSDAGVEEIRAYAVAEGVAELLRSMPAGGAEQATST
jgi:hypothetical protein